LRDDLSVAGVICLQGGHEFTADCRAMDAEVLQLAGNGRVAIIAGAARPGADYSGATERARRHYVALGGDVIAVPDPRESVSAAVKAMTDDISLVVLPGGSPASLREVLSGRVATRLLEIHTAGTAISGASAGAMVLCSRMVRPGRQAEIVDGLKLVRGLALPHWTPNSDRGWPVPDDLDLWGLPECGGVVLIDGVAHAVGRGRPAVRSDGRWNPIQRRSTGVARRSRMTQMPDPNG
jgi:peptidase E